MRKWPDKSILRRNGDGVIIHINHPKYRVIWAPKDCGLSIGVEMDSDLPSPNYWTLIGYQKEDNIRKLLRKIDEETMV